MQLNKQPITILAMFCLLTGAMAMPSLLVVSSLRINISAPVFAAVLALGAASVGAGFASWVLGLIISAGRRRWDWFVAVLILGAPASLALGLVPTDAVPERL